MFLKCSWILLFKFHKKHYSSFSWFTFLKPIPLYRFQISFYDAKTFVILFLLIFVFHEICLWLLWDWAFLKKTFKSIVMIFSMLLVLEKCSYVLEMVLNCSWIFIAKITGHPGKNKKNLNISRTKRAFAIK